MAGSAVIGALRVNLGIDSAAFSDGLKKAQSGLQKFGSMAKTGLLAAGAAAAAAASAVGYAVKNTIDAADDMSKAAAKIGVPIEELSRLKYAADLSGVSFEGLQTSIGRLSRVMNDAKNGSKEAVDSFAQIGVSATNADGSLKSASQVLAEISDKFASMPDGAEKTALAMELMGRSGADMIPLLNGGAAALQSLMGEADSFGQVFTAEMGANAEAFNDNISRLQGVFANITAQIATALLPHLTSFSNWLVENGPQIAAFAASLIEGVAALVQFGAAVVQLGVDIGTFLAGAWASFEAAWDGMIAKVGEVKAAIDQFAHQLVDAFAAIPGKMLEIGAAIIDGLWQGLQSKFAEVKNGLVNYATGLVDSVKSTLGIQSPSKVMAGVGVNIMDGLGQGMESAADSVENLASSIASTITNAFMSVIDGSKSVGEAIKDVIKQLGTLLLNNAFQKLFGGMGGGLLGGLSLPGFARGGSILPGGAGGIDSQVVAFRKSPAEQVDIYDPRKQGGRSGGLVYAPTIDARGADQAAITRLKMQLDEQARKFGAMVDARMKTRDLRGVRA